MPCISQILMKFVKGICDMQGIFTYRVKKVGIDFEKNIDISVVTCYHVKKQMTENKVKEQKEYLYGTALQRVGDGEIPAGKYKGNGFVRCKANTRWL